MRQPTKIRLLDDRFGWGQALGMITIVLTLIGAWALVAGRTFAAAYFGYFGMGLIGLNVPPELYAVYSVIVFGDHWILILGLSVSAGVLLWALARYAGRYCPSPLLMILGVALFIWIFHLGNEKARESAQSFVAKFVEADFRGVPRVTIWAETGGAPAKLKAELEALGEGCHRLLLQDADALYLIKPERFKDPRNPEAPAKLTAASRQPTVLILPRERVRAMRILTITESCML